eukprot:EG_transcript_34780
MLRMHRSVVHLVIILPTILVRHTSSNFAAVDCVPLCMDWPTHPSLFYRSHIVAPVGHGQRLGPRFPWDTLAHDIFSTRTKLFVCEQKYTTAFSCSAPLPPAQTTIQDCHKFPPLFSRSGAFFLS